MTGKLKNIALYLGIYRFAKKTKIILYDIINSDTILQNREKEIAFYSALIKPGQLCFDVGANVGDKSEIFLKTGAKVVAIEPQKECLKKIKRRFRKIKDIKIIDKGLSDKPGSLTLSISNKTSTISTMSEKWKKEGPFSTDYLSGTELKVEVTTLDSLIREFGCPDYIKIDVEGYELNVIKGLTQPVGLISFEFIGEFFDDSVKCIEYLSLLGRIRINAILGIPEKFLFDDFLNPPDFLAQMRTLNTLGNCGDIFVMISP